MNIKPLLKTEDLRPILTAIRDKEFSDLGWSPSLEHDDWSWSYTSWGVSYIYPSCYDLGMLLRIKLVVKHYVKEYKTYVIYTSLSVYPSTNNANGQKGD